MTEQLEMVFGTKYKLTVEDLDTKSTTTMTVDIVNDNTQDIANALAKAVREAVMTNETKKPEEQTQDLTHQRPEETDNLSKSARPDKTYTEDRGLDQDSLGKSRG